jgi:hypothetical protein
VWQQKRYKYRYRYAYRPEVHIYKDGSSYIMDVSVMNEPIEVVPAQVATEGTIVSEFTGFNQDMTFEFQNGQTWGQAEYKYSYHYAYRPHGIVINGINGYQLHVDGMSETVRVRRA